MTPQELIAWTLSQHSTAVITTSFGDRSAVLLHMVSQIDPEANIVWVDTGYNTDATLKYAINITRQLSLNVHRYTAHPYSGEVPAIDTPEYNEFVDTVKLRPFQEAISDLEPEFWIAGLRKVQNDHRNGLQQIDQTNGITKICPLLEWTNKDMDNYIQLHNLPNESNYFDPTKLHEHRECGLHTRVSLHPEV